MTMHRHPYAEEAQSEETSWDDVVDHQFRRKVWAAALCLVAGSVIAGGALFVWVRG